VDEDGNRQREFSGRHGGSIRGVAEPKQKINATNSWNFALIDYFHDMSLLKEGDGVNFQRASCTLDGCVKIYTNRVDSVATETGKLLSGLADSRSKKGKDDGDDGEADEDDDGEDDGEEGGKKKSRKRVGYTASPMEHC
jgi:condensin complex subunit 2